MFPFSTSLWCLAIFTVLSLSEAYRKRSISHGEQEFLLRRRRSSGFARSEQDNLPEVGTFHGKQFSTRSEQHRPSERKSKSLASSPSDHYSRKSEPGQKESLEQHSSERRHKADLPEVVTFHGRQFSTRSEQHRPSEGKSKSLASSPSDHYSRKSELGEKESLEQHSSERRHKADQFSVLTYNLWGYPGRKDKNEALSAERVRNSMNGLITEVSELNPWVVGFQEYKWGVFDEVLDMLWYKYNKCVMYEEGVKIGVRANVQCRIGKIEAFSKLPDCAKKRSGKFARKYQSVEIKVNSTWVTVAVLHLLSGSGARDCKKASLGHSFANILAERQPGIVMGDMNWFAKDYKAGSDSIPITEVHNFEHFIDAAALDGSVTFPAWDPDLKNPNSKFASRLDRVFYTSHGLTTTGYKMVNKLTNIAEPGKKYSYISDHVGSFVSFKLDEMPPESSLEERWKGFPFGRLESLPRTIMTPEKCKKYRFIACPAGTWHEFTCKKTIEDCNAVR